MQLNRTYWAILFVMSIFSCNRQEGEEKQVAESPDLATAMREASLEHRLSCYWDDFDFSDTIMVRSPAVGEQKFVDFIAMLPNVSDSVAAFAIQTMLKKSEVEEVSFRYYIEKYRHYLYDPNSPMRDETYYEPVLAYLVRSPKTNATDRVRYKTLLTVVSRNQRGSVATNFRYLNVKGGYNTLHEGKTDYKLLVLYDPTCPHCAVALHDLANSGTANGGIRRGQLEVVAVCALKDRKLWKDYQVSIPKNWTSGLDEKGEIIEKGLYDVRAFPAIYLLNRENKVLLKDAPLDVVLQYLLRHVPS